MHQIISLDKVSRQTVRDMAIAAAERGEPLDTSNVFEPGTDNHRDFRCDYLQCESALLLAS